MSAGISLSRILLKIVFDSAISGLALLFPRWVNRERKSTANVTHRQQGDKPAPQPRESFLRSTRGRGRQAPDSATGFAGFVFGTLKTQSHRALELVVRLGPRETRANDLFVQELALDIDVGQHAAVAVAAFAVELQLDV